MLLGVPANGCAADILYWRLLEEDALLSRYGGRYREYREATWF